MDMRENQNNQLHIEEEGVRDGTRKAEQDKKRKRTLTVIGILAIIVIIILLLLTRCSGPAGNPLSEKPRYSTEIDANASAEDFARMSKEEIVAALNEKVKEGMITISMATQVTFADGKAEGDLLIMNDAGNRHPQVVEINMTDENETLIYQSKMIPVGNNIKSGKLLVDLPAGEYPCIATFNAVDENTGTLLGQARAEIKIIVLK